MKAEVNILVVGDSGVGKSSLINTYISQHFYQSVPPVLTDAKLPPDVSNDVSITIMDSSCEMSDRDVLKLKIRIADSVIALYDTSRPETLFNLSQMWLPLIRECSFGKSKSAIVCGTKTDITEDLSTDEENESLRGILHEFPFVMVCCRSSAKKLDVENVFYHAEVAIKYPLGPIYDIALNEFTLPCKMALLRVFRSFDGDGDGLLCDEELIHLQYKCFGNRLSEEDVAALKKQISKTHDGIKQKSITFKGFLGILGIFVERLKQDAPWKILRMFGYADDLDLIVPDEVLIVPDGEGPDSLTELSVGAVNFLVRLAKSAATNQLTVLEDLGEQIPVTGEPTSTSADGIGPVAIQSAATGDDGENVAAAGGGVRFASSQQPQPAQSQTSAPTSLSTKERGQSAVAGAGGSGGSTLTEQAAGESVHNCQLTWEGIQNIICVVPEAVRIPWEHPPYYQVTPAEDEEDDEPVVVNGSNISRTGNHDTYLLTGLGLLPLVGNNGGQINSAGPGAGAGTGTGAGTGAGTGEGGDDCAGTGLGSPTVGHFQEADFAMSSCTELDWLAQWQLLALHQPMLTQALLYRIGYVLRDDLGIRVVDRRPAFTSSSSSFSSTFSVAGASFTSTTASANTSASASASDSSGSGPQAVRGAIHVCLLGSSGSGKSTFLHRISKLPVSAAGASPEVRATLLELGLREGDEGFQSMASALTASLSSSKVSLGAADSTDGAKSGLKGGVVHASASVAYLKPNVPKGIGLQSKVQGSAAQKGSKKGIATTSMKLPLERNMRVSSGAEPQVGTAERAGTGEWDSAAVIPSSVPELCPVVCKGGIAITGTVAVAVSEVPEAIAVDWLAEHGPLLDAAIIMIPIGEGDELAAAVSEAEKLAKLLPPHVSRVYVVSKADADNALCADPAVRSLSEPTAVLSSAPLSESAVTASAASMPAGSSSSLDITKLSAAADALPSTALSIPKPQPQSSSTQDVDVNKQGAASAPTSDSTFPSTAASSTGSLPLPQSRVQAVVSRLQQRGLGPVCIVSSLTGEGVDAALRAVVDAALQPSQPTSGGGAGLAASVNAGGGGGPVSWRLKAAYVVTGVLAVAGLAWFASTHMRSKSGGSSSKTTSSSSSTPDSTSSSDAKAGLKEILYEICKQSRGLVTRTT